MTTPWFDNGYFLVNMVDIMTTPWLNNKNDIMTTPWFDNDYKRCFMFI